MSELEGEANDAFVESHYAQFSHAGAIDDQSLSQLRDHIKKVMIPLLIKSFQLKLELSQSISLPSRLQPIKQKQSSEEIIEQLKQLDKDLQVLFLWCQSCRNQIQKAILLPEEEMKNSIKTTLASACNPAVTKSFSEAVSAQSTLFKTSTPKEMLQDDNVIPVKDTKKRWWHKIFQH